MQDSSDHNGQVVTWTEMSVQRAGEGCKVQGKASDVAVGAAKYGSESTSEALR